MSIRRSFTCASLLAACVALGACHGRGVESTAPQLAAGAGNSVAGLVRTFRLTPSGGIGFDDLWFSPELRAVLAPAGGTGCVQLFDSARLAQTSLCGIGPAGAYVGGHGEGTTSADFGAGYVFAIERNSRSLRVVDPKLGQTIASSPLAGGPDYARWVTSKREVWVTEPDEEQIEVFSLTTDTPPKLLRAGAITVKGGPESLVIDASHDRAFTHLWQGSTVQVGISSRAVGPSFPNGCQGSRGIALDPERGHLFVGCSEGKALLLDVAHGGSILGTAQTSPGVDIIAINSSLHHLYVPAASDGTVAVLGATRRGELRKLGLLQAAKGTHCVSGDDHNRVWVCSPESGTLLVFEDPFAPVAP